MGLSVWEPLIIDHLLCPDETPHLVTNPSLFLQFYCFRGKIGNKDLKVIQKEMRAVICQITACVTFLPLLDCACKYLFALLSTGFGKTQAFALTHEGFH